jgi:hypothetical protein
MGDIRKNCWCFGDATHPCKRVWVVCTRCEKQRLDRDDYWVNVVPNKFNTFEDFSKEIKRNGEVIVRCNQGIHEIAIQNPYFKKKPMIEPNF